MTPRRRGATGLRTLPDTIAPGALPGYGHQHLRGNNCRIVLEMEYDQHYGGVILVWGQRVPQRPSSQELTSPALDVVLNSALTM